MNRPLSVNDARRWDECVTARQNDAFSDGQFFNFAGVPGMPDVAEVGADIRNARAEGRTAPKRPILVGLDIERTAIRT